MGASPNPKIRGTALVLVVVALLGYVGAITGLDAGGTGGRIAFAVVATVLLIPGLLLLRSKAPALRTVRLDPRGLVVAVSGAAEDVVPWESMRAFGLRGVGASVEAQQRGLPAPGLVLTVDCVPAAAPAGLRTLEFPQDNGTVRLVLGLTRAQAAALRAQLDEFADRIGALRPTDRS
jgi:hypothetical protein